MKNRRLPSPPNTYIFEQEKKCPVCDGTEGFLDAGWIQHKELKYEDIPFYRFMKGKTPNT